MGSITVPQENHIIKLNEHFLLKIVKKLLVYFVKRHGLYMFKLAEAHEFCSFIFSTLNHLVVLLLGILGLLECILRLMEIITHA
jgi:hypothetical protein